MESYASESDVVASTLPLLIPSRFQETFQDILSIA